MGLISFPQSLNHRRFKYLWLGHIASVAGRRMQLALVLWHLKTISDQPIVLGGVGIAQLLPVLALALVAGAVSDSINRRWLMMIVQIVLVVSSVLLGFLTFIRLDTIWLVYSIILVSAAAHVFETPAKFSLIPQLVPPKDLANAFSLTPIAFHLGNIIGPGLVGVIIGNLNMGVAYFTTGLLFIVAIFSLIWMGPVDHLERASLNQNISLPAIGEGLRFVLRHPLIYPSMLIDFFVTFLGSVTTLLPIFATQVLGVDAVGYGWLLAAVSVGGGLMAVSLSFFNRLSRQGLILLGSLIGYGFAVVVFGLSKSFWLSFVALVIIGASDTLSTVIRQTIRQMVTPDRLRGRMTSVNQLFFQGGPHLGEFRAGITAQWLGAPLAVVFGGMACILAVLWIAASAPLLRTFNGDEPYFTGGVNGHV